jgi:hypothetical protein
VPPIRHGEVVLPGGLTGIGPSGSLPSIDSQGRGPAPGAAAWAATGDGTWLVAVRTGAGAGVVAAAARTGEEVGGTVASLSSGACDRMAARCAGPTRGRESGATTGARSLGTPTAFTTGLSTSGFTGGGVDRRGVGAAASTLVTVDATAGGTPNLPPDSPSAGAAHADGAAPTIPARPMPGCPRFSSAWPVPDPSSHAATTNPPSAATRTSARITPRGAHCAPPAMGMAATGSPSTLPPDPALPGQWLPTLHAVTT